MNPITLPSRTTCNILLGKITDKFYVIPFIPSYVHKSEILTCLSSSCGLHSGLQTDVIWFNRPQGPPSGVCTGQINPHYSGNNFLTVVVFIS